MKLQSLWRVLREVDLDAIRQEADSRFRVMVYGEDAEDAEAVGALLSATSDGSVHPWLEPLAATATPADGRRPDAALLVSRTAELPPALALLRDDLRSGVPVVSVILGTSGPLDAVVRTGETARVAVRRLDDAAADALGRALLSAAPEPARLSLARHLEPLRDTYVADLIEETSKANAAYAFTAALAESVPALNVPLNLADMFVLTKNQLVMAYRICLAAGKSGRPRDVVGEVVGVLGGGFLLRQGARQLVGLVPILGVVPKVVVAYAGTWAVGTGVSAWAQRGQRITATALRRWQSEATTSGRRVADALMERSGHRVLPWRRRSRLPAGKTDDPS